MYGCENTDHEILLGGADKIRRYREELINNSSRGKWGKPVLLCMECTARGIRFLEPADQKSGEKLFLPENENIRLPLKN